MPDPTLTERLDLYAQCGVDVAKVGFDNRKWQWFWFGWGCENRDDSKDRKHTAASLALDAVCVEWLGNKEGVAIIPSRGQWAMIGRRVPWDIADEHYPSLSAAIHAAMAAVAETGGE